MLVFGGTRTYHRVACGLEDAGFEVRDCINWLYGSGFPKGKGCLKPAWEPILLCRKPGKRVEPLGIDACRVPCDDKAKFPDGYGRGMGETVYAQDECTTGMVRTPDADPSGRWPANVCHDGSDEVMAAFAAFGRRPPWWHFWRRRYARVRVRVPVPVRRRR
jgi:site-specific DNA-methyltransferase (adenine-specific)